MARNLALLRPPSVTELDVTEARLEVLRSGDDTWAGLDPAMRDYVLNARFRGRDGRYDFTHFWLVSLAAAPFVAVARAAGAHPAGGFVALNLACLILLAVVLVNRAGPAVATLVVSVALWWIDKAHADAFLVAALGAGLLWIDTRPAAALIALGLAAAQLPVFAAVLLVAATATVLRNRRDPRVWTAAAAAAALVALNFVYYLWHIGRLSPLAALATSVVPGVRLVLAPLVDLNIGIFWYAPVLTLLAVCGLTLRPGVCSRSAVLAGLAGVIALLFVSAQSPNLNHGGTPGPNRYGLWCLAASIPLAANAARRFQSARAAMAAGVVLTLVFSAVRLHPRTPDRSTEPTRLATFVWANAPALDNPIPEVFAERVSHSDGRPHLPIATAGCSKALLVGDGRNVWWPASCPPAAVPDRCAERGPTCYWNGAGIAFAPEQAPFVWRLDPTARQMPARF